MAFCEIHAEFLGDRWLGEIIGRNGGTRFGDGGQAPVRTLDDMLEIVRAAALKHTAPIAPSPPLDPPKPLNLGPEKIGAVTPRKPRGARRTA